MLTLNLFKKFIQKKFNKKKNTKLSYFVTNFSLKTKKFKLYFRKYLSKFYLWLICKKRFNEAIFRGIRRPYNVWIFFFNYSMHYYLLAKLIFVFIHYLFYIISQKFMKIAFKLRLKGFELAYDLIKYKDNSRYHLGIRPELFVTTFNRRIKKGFTAKKF
ncbi:MAG: hypothetical protein CMP47_12090 [Rickettsiales bacterium]|nr:hypothetical protein [Rickettsiales bacterium]